MLVDLSIIPLGGEADWTAQRAEALKLVEASGLAYQLTPSGLCIEGDWSAVMPLVQRCHERARKASRHVVTTLKIEDKEGVKDHLTRNVLLVEEKVGEMLRKVK